MAKVLVAEDEPGNRDALEQALRGWGFEVVTVDDGYQAVRELLVDPGIRLVLVDRDLGGMDGLGVCRVIRGLDRFVYAILMSSAGAADQARAREAGASECVRKPAQLDELLAVLEEGRRRTEEPS